MKAKPTQRFSIVQMVGVAAIGW